MITIYIDGKEYKTEVGENLLQTCIKLGIDIPYFCYHPSLNSVGSCRLCAVKSYRDKNDTKGRIIMSCMEPLTEGMIISTNDTEVKEFRAAIIESLMTNHPHDCPICDEGGECHLQDMVVKSGHVYRRFEFKKRTFKNQNLGPYIHHEMNRCIQCYRCVRFYCDYAGGKDFGVLGTHNQLYFGRFEEGQLESPFSGNLIEVCPTGVFTDKILRKQYVRKWDLTHAPSICNQCAVGCNIIMGERYGTVRRVLNRYNQQINGYFICDKGRFNFEYINNEKTRIQHSTIFNEFQNTHDILQYIDNLMLNNNTKIIGIGSPIASFEANYLLKKFVGENHFFAGIPKQELDLLKQIISIYQQSHTKIYNLKDIEQAEGILVLGIDVLEAAPRLALSIRQSIRNLPIRKQKKVKIPTWNANAVKTLIGNNKGPLYVICPSKTWLDQSAKFSIHFNLKQTIQLLKAIIALAKNASLINYDSETLQIAQQILEDFKECNSIAIISGTQANSSELLSLSAEIAEIFNNRSQQAGVYFTAAEANSIGLAILANQSIEQLFTENQHYNSFIAIENDLTKRFSTLFTKQFYEHFTQRIILHHTKNDFTSLATICLAVSTIAESDGTLINTEGRMQRYFSVIPTNENILPSWQWIVKIGKMNYRNIQEVLNDISKEIPILSDINKVAPDPMYRINGMKVPRQTPRYSGRTSMHAHINVHEQKPFDDDNSPLAYSMEGSKQNTNLSLTSFYLIPGWHSNQANNKLLRELDNVINAKSSGIRIWNNK